MQFIRFLNVERNDYLESAVVKLASRIARGSLDARFPPNNLRTFEIQIQNPRGYASFFFSLKSRQYFFDCVGLEVLTVQVSENFDFR